MIRFSINSHHNTSTSYAPWYVLPADNEWYSRALVAEVMIEKLEEIDPHYPEIPQEDKDELEQPIKKLESE